MELKEHQKEVIKSIENEKTPIYFNFSITKNTEFEQQREGRMHRDESQITKIESKKQFLDKVLKDTNVKKQKNNKNRDSR